MLGVNLLMLGSEAPVDDIPRELEILNQVVQDPTIDGLIMTTPQAGAYDDIVKKACSSKGIPVATTNSFDPATLYDRPPSATPARMRRAAAIGGEALAKCVLASGAKGGSIIFPNTTTLGNVEVNNRITAAFTATVATLPAAGKLGNFKVDAGPENIGIDVDANNSVGSIVSLIESRGDVVGIMGANGFVTPAIGDAVAQLKIGDKVCSYGFDLGPKQQEQIKTGALDGALGQQPFLQGFWPVMQLYLQIDRGIAAANLDTSAQLVTKDERRQGRQALRELSRGCTAGAGRRLPRRGAADACPRPLRRRLRASAGRSACSSSWPCSIWLGTWINPRFFGDLTALQSVLRDAARYGVMAVGMTFVIVNRDLDLSVGSTLGLVAVVFSIAFAPPASRPLGLGRASLICLAVGLGDRADQRRAGHLAARCRPSSPR